MCQSQNNYAIYLKSLFPVYYTRSDPVKEFKFKVNEFSQLCKCSSMTYEEINSKKMLTFAALFQEQSDPGGRGLEVENTGREKSWGDKR